MKTNLLKIRFLIIYGKVALILFVLFTSCKDKNSKDSVAIFISHDSRFDIFKTDTFNFSVSGNVYSYSNKLSSKIFKVKNDSTASLILSQKDTLDFVMKDKERVNYQNEIYEILFFECDDGKTDNVANIVFSSQFGIIKEYSRNWKNYQCLNEISTDNIRYGVLKTILLGNCLIQKNIDTNCYPIIPFE